MREDKWYVLVCCLLVASALGHLHKLYYDESVADIALELLIASVAAGLSFIACFRIFKRPKVTITKRLLPLCFWVASATVVVAYNYWINRIKSTPNYLRIISGHFGYEEFSLKKDGRYIYHNASFLSSSYNYGSYTRSDSIIILLPNTSRNAPQQLQLIIRPYTISSTPAFNKKSLVFAINQNGKPRRFDSGYQGHRIVELANE